MDTPGFEFWPSSNGNEGGASDEPDEDSTENAREGLDEFEQDLKNVGYLEPEEAQISRGFIDGYSEASLTEEEMAEALRTTMALIGVSDVQDITAERLLSADPEIAETLSPLTIESLYFETFRKMRRRVGNEPVKASRLIQQARTLARRGSDLENLQLKQRLAALNRLYTTAIDERQIQRMLRGRLSMQQNINRLDFLLFDEPALRPLTLSLVSRQETGSPISVERTLKIAKILLKRQIRSWNDFKDSQAKFDSKAKWDSIDWDVYKRATQRMDASVSIAEMIEKELQRPTGLDEFRQELGI